MTRSAHRTRRATVAVMALVGALSGCAFTGHSPTPAPSPEAAGHTAPKSLHTPASSAGSMSLRSFPRPRRLGGAWRYFVDPGSAEDGYLSNGTPALARNPAETVTASIPLGCRRPARMPTPQHVLEVDYTHRHAKVVALRMRFRDHPAAVGFFAARARNLGACRGRTGGPAVGVLVGSVVHLPHATLLSSRTPHSDPWTELALVDRSTVVLLAEQGGRGSGALTRVQASHIANAFRP